MRSILLILTEMPYVMMKVLHNHRLIDSLRIDLSTPVVMLIPSDVEDPFNTSSAR